MEKKSYQIQDKQKATSRVRLFFLLLILIILLVVGIVLEIVRLINC